MLWRSLALPALAAGRPLVSALAAAAGFSAKLLPGLVAVAWLRRYRLWHVLAGPAPGAPPALPYLDAGRPLLLSLGKYARFWRFNETLFAPLAALVGSHEGAVFASSAFTVTLALLLGMRRTEP